jgi:Tol biopolymer transport system component
MRAMPIAIVLSTALVTAVHAAPPAGELVSVRAKAALPYAMLGTQGAHHNLSADGRFVVFQAYEDGWHVFVRDTLLNKTERIDVSTRGEPANFDSEDPAISADGRYVVFESAATNLAPGDVGWGGIFLHDRQAGTTERVDVNAAGRSANLYSYAPFVSANGRFVVFVSYASNLVAHDANGQESDVFVRDRETHTTELVTVSSRGVQSNGFNDEPGMSNDGRFIVFVSTASNLTGDPVAGGFHVYLRDRVSGVTELVSPRASGARGNEAWPSVSDDGRYVVFGSSAKDLVPRDTNQATDIFVRDRVRDTTQRVSVGSDEAQADAGSDFASVSADGRYVAFQSYASNLVPHDRNHRPDIFVRDLQLGLTKRVTRSPVGATLDSISADGRFVSYDGPARVEGGTGVYLLAVGDHGWNVH